MRIEIVRCDACRRRLLDVDSKSLEAGGFAGYGSLRFRISEGRDGGGAVDERYYPELCIECAQALWSMVETWISKRAGEYVGVTANGGDGYGRPGAGGDVKGMEGP